MVCIISIPVSKTIEWRFRVNWKFQTGTNQTKTWICLTYFFSNIYFMLLLCVFVFVLVSICHMCVGTWEGQKCLIPRGLWVNQQEFWAPNHVFFHQVFAVHMLGHTLVSRILAFYKVTQGETLECHILNVIFHFMESLLDRRDRDTSGENINEGSEKRNMITCIFYKFFRKK